jgi:proteasome alpha subunit
MTDEPYRWLEAIGNRREYVQTQLKGGSPVFAASLPAGVVLLGVGTGHSKVFEIYDRHALAGLGHPADLERLRQSLIDAAHLEGFARAPEDVGLRRLVGFGLGPQLKTAFEQIFSPPFLVRLLLAEVGPIPARDVLVRVGYDGGYHLQHGGLLVAADDPAAEAGAEAWLVERCAAEPAFQASDPDAPRRFVELALEAWWCLGHGRPPGSPEAHAGWRADLRGKSVEVGWLARDARRAAYRPVSFP